MLNRIFKKLETTGRLNIPQELLKFVNINNGDKVAICTDEESGGFKLKSLLDAYNDRIVGIANTDSKGRFVFPKYLYENEEKEILQGFPWAFDNEILYFKHRPNEKSEWKKEDFENLSAETIL